MKTFNYFGTITDNVSLSFSKSYYLSNTTIQIANQFFYTDALI
ncbi:hypothetical protein [Pedobacter sp. N23S346]